MSGITGTNSATYGTAGQQGDTKTSSSSGGLGVALSKTKSQIEAEKAKKKQGPLPMVQNKPKPQHDIFDFGSSFDFSSIFSGFNTKVDKYVSQPLSTLLNSAKFSGKKMSEMAGSVFDKALAFVFKSEAGFANNKNDHGGKTNLGITEAKYNAYNKKHNLGNKDIHKITQEEATAIYKEDYWQAVGADKITDPKMAVALFDTAVLHGVEGAKKLYQQAAGDLNKFLSLRKERYSDIVKKDISQLDFFNGWNNRLNNLVGYLG